VEITNFIDKMNSKKKTCKFAGKNVQKEPS